MSFLSKIKKKTEAVDIAEEEKSPKRMTDEEASEHLQLDVDIYQTSSKIVVYAPIAGVKTDKLDIFVESENDVITISGKKEIPKLIKDDDDEKEYLCQENRWGEFYRQIILPEEINVAKIESLIENGVLVLKLPLLRIQSKGKKRIEVKEM
ncbi:MAG: Hsp20/alpha crystallin family protein, partial [Patescibacteria group bacterium]|nr:Hsp20/alpha crystallin family protein [Patescibacteria group bacterium]